MVTTTSAPTPHRALPHPKFRLPWFGDLLTTDPVKPVQMSWRDAQNLGEIFERKIMNWPMVVVSGTDLINEVNDEKFWTKHVGVLFKKLRPIARDGLFTAYNHEPNWHRAHNILAPSFTAQSMRSYHDTMCGVADELVDYWSDRAGQWVDTAEDMNRFTLEVIARAGFGGYDFESFGRGTPHPFVAAMLRSLRYINSYANLPTFLEKTVGRRAAAQHKRDIATTHAIVDEVIAARKAGGTVGEHGDLLDRMLTVEDPETGERLSDTNIRYQIFTFLVAGHETSAGALAFALYELARNPEAAAKVRAEIDERFPGRDRPTIAFEDVAKLRSVRRVVDETLRLWPVAPGYFREAITDVTIGDGYHFKPGDWVFVLTLQAHRDKSAWGEDADQFEPDRWLRTNLAETDNRRIYKPFGTGLRACVGRQFAYHEIMLALTYILHQFDFEHEPDYALDIAEQITLKPRGFKLRVTPRR
ncbi:cytochrome P450 [Nocardia sp. NPDC055029]